MVSDQELIAYMPKQVRDIKYLLRNWMFHLELYAKNLVFHKLAIALTIVTLFLILAEAHYGVDSKTC